jgi:hypothetical protein
MIAEQSSYLRARRNNMHRYRRMPAAQHCASGTLPQQRRFENALGMSETCQGRTWPRRAFIYATATIDLSGTSKK